MRHNAEAEDIALSIVCLYAGKLVKEDLWRHVAYCPAFPEVVLLEGMPNVHRETEVYQLAA
jgi:hypothetical protein